MERQMRINEDILRFLTVRVDELEEGPSAMLQSRGRDERPRRFDDRPRRSEDRGGRFEDRGPRNEPVQAEAGGGA
jgi:small subunit ribosomal protein S6